MVSFLIPMGAEFMSYCLYVLFRLKLFLTRCLNHEQTVCHILYEPCLFVCMSSLHNINSFSTKIYSISVCMNSCISVSMYDICD